MASPAACARPSLDLDELEQVWRVKVEAQLAELLELQATSDRVTSAVDGVHMHGGAEGVSYDHAWLDPETGKAFCLVTGPNKEAVIRVHEKAGHPASGVYELSIQTS